MISGQLSGWAGLPRRPDWAGLGQQGSRPGWAGPATQPERLGWAFQAAGLGWAGLAELSEQWQVVVKCRFQTPTGITDSMDQCSKDM